MLNTYTSYALLGFLITAIWAPLLIALLYRFNIVIHHKLMKNQMNAEFIKIHGHKSGTPRSGGLMISVTVFVLAVILIPYTPIKDVFLYGWAVFAIYGLSDDLLVSYRKISDKFRLFQESFVWRLGKLGLLYLLALIAVIMAVHIAGIQTLIIWDRLGITLNAVAIAVIAFLMVLAMYAFEITDGADGLITGQFLIDIAAVTVVAVFTNHAELLPYLGLIMGSCIVYLYFNINPARVFMGGSGTLPIAFALILFTAVTDTLAVFLILGAVYWVELFSSMSQIIAIRFFKRKIFKIAPIHHHFEAIGWPETKVVQRFWLASGLAAVVALWVLSVMR